MTIMAKKVIKVKCVQSHGMFVAKKKYDVFLDKSNFLIGRVYGKPFAILNDSRVLEKVSPEE